MSENEWMIYGANGFTGELIARKAVSLGMKPILAGRNHSQILQLARELGLDCEVFSLDNTEQVASRLKDMKAVLHCAGPFIHTCEVMATACIQAECHYLDITGEIPVFEKLYSLSEKAVSAGVMLLPGTGFDVVPTDCMALTLKEALPDATELSLGFAGFGAYSTGTARSALLQLPGGSKVRENGLMRSIPIASRSRKVRMGDREISFFSIPWGDVFTSYISTGIPNVTVYTALPNGLALLSKIARPVMPLMRTEVVKNFLMKKIARMKNPTEAERKKSRLFIWGEAVARDGRKFEELWMTKDGYNFTADSAVSAMNKVLSGVSKPGFCTPSLAFGSQFAIEINGTRRLNKNGDKVEK